MGENGQYFTKDSKVLVGQDRRFRKSSFGCEDIWVAIDWVTCRFLRAHVSKGLNVQSGHCNDPQHRVRAVSVWSGGLKIETWEAQKGIATLERYPAQVAFLAGNWRDCKKRPKDTSVRRLGTLPTSTYEPTFKKTCHRLHAFNDFFGRCRPPMKNPTVRRLKQHHDSNRKPVKFWLIKEKKFYSLSISTNHGLSTTCSRNMEESSWTRNWRNNFTEFPLPSTTVKSFIWKFLSHPRRSLRTPSHPPHPLCQKKKKNPSNVKNFFASPSTMAPFHKSTRLTGSRFKKPGIRIAGFKGSSFLRFCQSSLRRTSILATFTGWSIDLPHHLPGLLNIILHTPSPKSSHRTSQIKSVTPIPRHRTSSPLTTSTSKGPSKSEIISNYVPPTRRKENKSSKFPRQDQDFIRKIELRCVSTFTEEHWKNFSLPVFAPWT